MLGAAVRTLAVEALRRPKYIPLRSRAAFHVLSVFVMCLYVSGFVGAFWFFRSQKETVTENSSIDGGLSCLPLQARLDTYEFRFTNSSVLRLSPSGNTAASGLFTMIADFVGDSCWSDTQTEREALRYVLINGVNAMHTAVAALKYRGLFLFWYKTTSIHRVNSTVLSVSIGTGLDTGCKSSFEILYDISLIRDPVLLAELATLCSAPCWARLPDSQFDNLFTSIFPEIAYQLRADNGPFACTRTVSKSLIESAVLAFSVVTTFDIVVVRFLRQMHSWMQRRCFEKKKPRKVVQQQRPNDDDPWKTATEDSRTSTELRDPSRPASEDSRGSISRMLPDEYEFRRSSMASNMGDGNT